MKEPSTYAGIAALFMLFGKNVDAEKLEAVATVGAAIAGTITVLLPEKKD